MLGNLHVRFGERDEETWLREGLKRFIPTLPLVKAAPIAALMAVE